MFTYFNINLLVDITLFTFGYLQYTTSISIHRVKKAISSGIFFKLHPPPKYK